MKPLRTIGRSGPGAFTMMEVLVSVAVIGILAVLLLPTFSNIRKAGQSAACISNIRQLVAALVSYSVENDGYLPPPYQAVASPNAATVFNSYMINGEPWKLVYPYVTSDPNYAAQKIFYCPTNVDPVHGMKKQDWDTNWKYSSYYYFYPFDKVSGSNAYAPLRLGVNTDGVVPILSDMVKKASVIPNFHDGKGVNVGFSDGSVLHIRTDPNEEYYKDILPGYPGGSVSKEAIIALAKKFKESREGRE